MNAPTTDCDHRRIDDFLDSNRVGLDNEQLLEHLNTCTACREYMETRAADSDSWASVGRLLQQGEFDHASSDEYSLATAGSGRVDPPAAIQGVLDLLTPSEEPSRLGRLGTYEVSGVIGAGGMGVVLKAVDPALDRVVAIKVLAPHLAHSGTARRRFSREAKAAAAVLHPNVISIHSVSSDEKIPYLVMAYIRGGSLQKRLNREGPLSTVEILRIGSQVAAGLAAAHEQGLVHRDVKPENILLEEGVERITLTDFGLARAVDDASVTQPGIIAGTPQYMSPEQTRGEPIDQQSDLFSLGCVLYALCTGRPPFRADSSYAVMRKISDELPMPIRELNPDIPEWLCAIIVKLMSKKKADRFRSAGEVHDLLESCLSHVQQPLMHSLPGNLTNPPKQLFSPLAKASLGAFSMLTIATVFYLLSTIWMGTPPSGVTTSANSTGALAASTQQGVSDEKQTIAISQNEARLRELVEDHPIVVHVVLEKANYTGMLNSHRVQVKKIYKGQNLDVKSIFAHSAFNDADYPLGSKKPKNQMPELIAGEYLMVLEAEPVTDSFAISSFGLRVTPEPSFSYTIARDGVQHAAWPVDSPQAQTVMRLCAADKTSSQTPTAASPNVAQAQSMIASIEQACKTYKLSVGSYPGSLEDLQRLPNSLNETQWGGPYLDAGSSTLNDPWGQPFEIQVDEAGELTIRSCGPDGKSGTQDDIDNHDVAVQSQGGTLEETAKIQATSQSNGDAPLTWKSLLGKEPPEGYPADALTLIQSLNNSRGEWVFAGKIKREGEEAEFEAAVEIQGGFKNMIRQDSFPQWQIVIAWPREVPTNGLVLNVMALPEPDGIKWILAPQHSSKDGGPVPGRHKMYKGSWNAEAATVTWTSTQIPSPLKDDDAAEEPDEPKATFEMVVKANGEIQFTSYQHNESLSFSGKAAARVGEPFVEKEPAIPKLPGGYKLFFASRLEIALVTKSGVFVAGPRIEKIGCDGNLIFGLIAMYVDAERSDTPGYFWLDATTGKITKGMEVAAWREVLKSKGISEPRLFAPESVGE